MTIHKNIKVYFFFFKLVHMFLVHIQIFEKYDLMVIAFDPSSFEDDCRQIKDDRIITLNVILDINFVLKLILSQLT